MTVQENQKCTKCFSRVTLEDFVPAVKMCQSCSDAVRKERDRRIGGVGIDPIWFQRIFGIAALAFGSVFGLIQLKVMFLPPTGDANVDKTFAGIAVVFLLVSAVITLAGLVMTWKGFKD